MHAMTVDEGRNLRWAEVPDAVAGPGEVLIEVHAAALNRADLLQRAGNYPSPPGWPDRMGLEVGGVVLSAPVGSRWVTGNKVCALLGGGGYGEKINVPENMVLPVPAGLTMAEAASLPEAYATAYLNLFLEADLKAGETVLIQAGASGLGIAAIQLAKVFGAKVMTTVGSEAKAEAVRRLGADWVVNRKTGDLGQMMEDHPVNIALDCAGGADLGKHLEKMAPGGRWILIATLSGETSELALRPVLKRGLRLIGSTLRSRSTEMKGRILADLESRVWPKIEAGLIRPVLYKTLPMADAEAAHTILSRNENTGKVVLTISRETRTVPRTG